MMDWDIVKFIGAFYAVIAPMITGMALSLGVPLNEFLQFGLLISSIYWGIGFMVALLEN